MKLPEPLLLALENVPGFDRTAFEAVHASGSGPVSIRINPRKFSVDGCRFSIETEVPWSSSGYYLTERPSFTFDPIFHAGCYYVQEPSSMFVEQALRQLVDLSQPLKVLDLCAAPGGKSTHIQSLISPDSLLVSNEVIRSRAAVLKQNIIKWGSANVVVTNNDPAHFARLDNFFDLMVVDAPCSGSGLFRKDPAAVEEWSIDAVQLCASRQKRILADALPALRQGGLLLYATCSYSQEEDESISDWLAAQGYENLSLKIEEAWGIVQTKAPASGAKGYRFFPHKSKGEGFYLGCFRKTGGDETGRWKAAKPEKATAREVSAVAQWIEKDGLAILRHPWLYAIREPLKEPYSIIKNYLNVQYAGIALGTVMKEKLVPEHALALTDILHPGIRPVDLDYENAIRYLQRQDMQLPPTAPGWQPVSFHMHNLGWINALHNRINNYYPKELRILKQGIG